MSYRLVNICRAILRSIPEQGQGVSEIMRQTSQVGKSPDRTFLIQVLKILEKEGLLKPSKKWKFGQKKIMKRTQLGNEIKDLIEDIEMYKFSYQQLLASYEKHIRPYSAKNKLSYEIDWKSDVRKLKAKGWTDIEISSFHKWVRLIWQFKSICMKDYFSALTYRYGSIVFANKIGENTQKIIITTILDGIDSFLSLVSGQYKDFQTNVDESERKSMAYDLFSILLDRLHNSTFKDMEDLYNQDNNLSRFKFMKNEINDVTFSLLKILNLPEIVLMRYRRVLNNGKDPSSTDSTMHEDRIELLSIYDRLISNFEGKLS